MKILPKIIISLIFIYIFLLSIQSFFFDENNLPHGFTINPPFVEYNLGQRPSFFTYKNNIFFISSYGLYYFYNDQEHWYFNHHFEQPILTGESQFIAIWELSGRVIYIFNNYGNVFYHHTIGYLLNISINRYGYLAFITEYNNNYEIFGLNPSGNIIFSTTFSNLNIFPLSLFFNGYILGISLMNTSHINIKSNVVLFDINEGAFGATPMEYGIISIIRFVNNKLFIISKTRIVAIDLSLNTIWEKYISIDNAIFGNETLTILSDKSIIFLRLDGYKLGSYTSSAPITFFGGNSDNIILGSGRRFVSLNYYGYLWEFISIPEPLGLYILNNPNQMLLKTAIGGHIVSN